MLDDLEDLLDDLNDTLGTPLHDNIPPRKPGTSVTNSRQPVKPAPAPPRASETATSSRYSSGAGASKSSLDDLLSDLDDIMPGENKNPVKQEAPAARPSYTKQTSNLQNKAIEASEKGARRVKCSSVFLGGSHVKQGCAGLQKLCCNKLRCLQCDLMVVSFDNKKWTPDVDYMFFRNAYPNEYELGRKMRPQANTRAYACQCTWTTQTDLTVLGMHSQFRWVCRGHD
mmetsp:Transcript_6980/g.7976  ORF Transcript_6980/g.7976 Transcript_6980/m.7976 type:complete len:227 (-) Transcript_6980:12-692(-)